MKKILFILSFISMSAFGNDGYLKIIAEEYVKGVSQAVAHYNKNRLNLPEIKRNNAQYFFYANEKLVEFTTAELLDNKIRVDQKLQSIPLALKSHKTVRVLEFFLSTAVANDSVIAHGEATKVIVATLGSLEKSLKEIGLICLSSCQKETIKNNMDKIKRSIERKYQSCQNIVDAQTRSPDSDLYTVTADTEKDFREVKELIVRMSELRANKIKTFYKDYMATEPDKLASCMDIVTKGTVIDRSGGALAIGTRNIAEIRLSPEKEAMKNAALGLCAQIEELRSCLAQAASNYNAVIDGRRGGRKGTDSLPSLNIPEGVQNIER